MLVVVAMQTPPDSTQSLPQYRLQPVQALLQAVNAACGLADTDRLAPDSESLPAPAGTHMGH